MWIKYRTKMSAGPSDWQFREVDSKEDAEEFLQSVADNHNWSEHWRGIDWKIIKLPPRFVIQEALDSAKAYLERMVKHTIHETEMQIESLAKLLKTKQPQVRLSCPKCGNRYACKPRKMRDGDSLPALRPLKRGSDDCYKQFILKDDRSK